MSYEVELDRSPGRAPTEESLVVTHPDGAVERMRLHDYERVYAVPGLYEEVVQRRLECASPRKLADALVDCAAREGRGPAELRVFDLGAGNGVGAEELHARGVRTIVGADSIQEARDATLRDRPEVFCDYLVGDAADFPGAGDVVRRHELNGLVCSGALGLGHITADSFAGLWDRFPADALFAVSVNEQLAEPDGSDFGAYLHELDHGDSAEIVLRERFRHRFTMAGAPLHHVAVVARKR